MIAKNEEPLVLTENQVEEVNFDSHRMVVEHEELEVGVEIKNIWEESPAA